MVAVAAVCAIAAMLSAIAIPMMINAAWNFTTKRPTPAGGHGKSINLPGRIFCPLLQMNIVAL
jgi:hypothetical protein